MVQADQAVRESGLLEAAILRNPDSRLVTITGQDIGDLGMNLGRGFERVAGSKLQPDLQGAPRLVSDLRSVQATYEYNSASKTWETVTIFPVR